jgi:transposase
LANGTNFGIGKREIGRRLSIDIKTVRWIVRKIEAGVATPKRRSPGSKLDSYDERIVELATYRRTAWNVYLAVRDAGVIGSYELLKKRDAVLRRKEPRVFERLEHLPGAEMQADFGELCRVRHQGQLVRTWAYGAVWPHSRYRYAEIALDETVPTFLSAMQCTRRACRWRTDRGPS